MSNGDKEAKVTGSLRESKETSNVGTGQRERSEGETEAIYKGEYTRDTVPPPDSESAPPSDSGQGSADSGQGGTDSDKGGDQGTKSE